MSAYTSHRVRIRFSQPKTRASCAAYTQLFQESAWRVCSAYIKKAAAALLSTRLCPRRARSCLFMYLPKQSPLLTLCARPAAPLSQGCVFCPWRRRGQPLSPIIIPIMITSKKARGSIQSMSQLAQAPCAALFSLYTLVPIIIHPPLSFFPSRAHFAYTLWRRRVRSCPPFCLQWVVGAVERLAV